MSRVEENIGRLPEPDWTRPGETWRIEPERGWLPVDIDGEEVQCWGQSRHCSIPATAQRTDNGAAYCVSHLRFGRMWIEDERVVSWRLSR